MMSRARRFDEAIATVVATRGAVYGGPLENFSLVAALHEPLQGCADPLVRYALQQICVKIARICTAPPHTDGSPDYMDSVHDIAGYARTIAMLHDEREETLCPEEATKPPDTRSAKRGITSRN